MKTLIVYYSFTHNNEVLAKDLQKKLDCDIHKIEEPGKRTGFTILLDLIFNRTPEILDYYHPLDLYQHHIFIAPVWAGKIASPLRSFLIKEKDLIKRYSLITVCGGNAGQAEKINSQLTKLLGHAPEAVTELWVNDLLPEEKKNTIKYTSGYRISDSDLETFRQKIHQFLKSIKAPVEQKATEQRIPLSAN